MFRKYPELFQDPHIQYPIDDPDLPFADYIAKSKKIISEYRRDLNAHANLVIEANEPFELRPEHPLLSASNPQKFKYGALLIHGLLDTPFIMKDIGKQLQSQGLLVRAIMLPGHGSVPGSLLNVKYEDWLKAVRYGIHSLLKEVDQVFLVGYSTGATLGLYHTLLNPDRIAGNIMLAPAFKIYSPFAFLTNAYKVIDWAWPRARWAQIGAEIDYTKYSSMPFNAAYQVYRLTKALRKVDRKILNVPPLFMVLSYEDFIVSSKATIEYFRTLNNSKDRLIIYAKNSHKFRDPRIIKRSSQYPHWHIESISHISIPISPHNPHYGKNGDYPLASHVETDGHYIYTSLDMPNLRFHDLLYKLKLSKYQYQRLTFNPDFEFMTSEIKKFIFS